MDETLELPFQVGLGRVAERKRDAVGGPVVLAADTIGILQGELLKKPKSLAEATQMLQHMNNQSHDVWTAVAVTGKPAELVRTKVYLALPQDVLAAYLAAGLWEGKAGSYGIQDPLIAPFIRIDGSWSNVVGLPLEITHKLLSQVGVSVQPCPSEAHLQHQNPFHPEQDSV